MRVLPNDGKHLGEHVWSLGIVDVPRPHRPNRPLRGCGREVNAEEIGIGPV